MTREGKAASVRQRLLNLAQSRGEDYNQVLARYAGLRFLARLAASEFSTRFMLKGATMFLVWHGSVHRPTKDIDLLGFLEADEAALSSVIRSVCAQEVEEDGISFDPDSVEVAWIREDTVYGGLRCIIGATLGTAKLRVQLDVGFCDVVTPGPETAEIPRLLDDEVRRVISAYTPVTSAAEKIEAIVKLGLANSRMKDYLDLDLLISRGEVEPSGLAPALVQTFNRRATPLPSTLPQGLTEEFWRDPTALRRCQAFLTRNRLDPVPLEAICQRIGSALELALDLVSRDSTN